MTQPAVSMLHLAQVWCGVKCRALGSVFSFGQLSARFGRDLHQLLFEADPIFI